MMALIHSQELFMSPQFTRKSRLVATFFVPMLALEMAAPMLVSAMDNEDLYRLCSAFPFNSQCKGYEAPVPLSQRSGKDAGCIIKGPESEIKGACKISVENNEITLYHETGAELSILNNQKSTVFVKIPTQSVSCLQYRETRKLNSGNAVFNTLAFGLLGLALTKKRTYAEIAVNYNDPAITANGASSGDVTLIFDQKNGLAMRSQLEQATGKTAETPLQKPAATQPTTAPEKP
jgi:hypothetical protein